MGRRKGIIKIRTEKNDTETKTTSQKINESRSWFFEKRNKTDKPLSRLIKKKTERTKINEIRNGSGELITDITEITRTVRKYYEQLYTKKMDNLGEMDKFLETHNLPKLSQEEAENLNRLITANEIEAVIKKLKANKSPISDVFTGQFYQSFKEGLIPIHLKLFQKIQEEESCPTLYKANSILIPRPGKTKQRKKVIG